MKATFIFLLLFFVCYHRSKEEGVSIPEKVEVKIKKADFMVCYNKIRHREGFYVNDPDDFGRETYAGVTSRYNPDWYGWRYIKNKNLKKNQRVEEAEMWVLDYYLHIWVSEGFDNLTNQEIADYLFDMRINMPKKTKKLLGSVYGIQVKLGESWVDTTMDTLTLSRLKGVRIKYYKTRAHTNPSQKKFLKSWLRRAQ